MINETHWIVEARRTFNFFELAALRTRFRSLWSRVVKYVMKDAFMRELVAKLEPVFESVVHRVVKQKLDPILVLLQSSQSRSSLVDQPETSGSRGLQLRFANKLPSTLFTNSRIEADGNAPIKIELIDANSKIIVKHSPLSSIKIEIMVLSGDFAANGQEDWNEREFSDSIVHERTGKRPLLVGNLSVSLIHGVGFINDITFTDNSSWVRSRKFRLGVRVVPCASYGIGIKEAVTDAFVVLDHRGESYQKHNTPALNDPVWRLKRIAKDGASHKRLAQRGIQTVKDFLRRYHINPHLLRQILGNGVANKAWEKIIEHANACHLDRELYLYYNAAKGLGLLFNCVYKVIEVTDGQIYQSVDTLSKDKMAQVDELKLYAYENLNELVPIDNVSATSPLMAFSIHNTAPFSSAVLDFQPNGVPIMGQDMQEMPLDFYHPETSASHPYLTADGSRPSDESSALSGVPFQSLSPPMSSLEIGDSSSNLFNGGGYEWNPSSSVVTLVPDNCVFREIYPLQATTTGHPPPAAWENWAHASSLFTTSSSNAHIGIFSHHISGGVNPKARWCKIRAAVRLKMVNRRAAARRKGKSAFHFC
ncbi:hypothetical protein Nepgr_009567 [Nepenthes gracilis]|uniref:Calmodulin-binding protein n=1 Tax=Nepenthes gracilis TaxID=150966 RepID=A0AAD3SBN1_NEPGR|nr:hypothetical protein Nepgr_009567 [Nepenthes gracilis]